MMMYSWETVKKLNSSSWNEEISFFHTALPCSSADCFERCTDSVSQGCERAGTGLMQTQNEAERQTQSEGGNSECSRATAQKAESYYSPSTQQS